MATPAGAYIPARRSGSLVFTAGPAAAGRRRAAGHRQGRRRGRPGHRRRPGPHLRAERAGRGRTTLVGLDAVTGVVKVVGFVASAPGFTGQPKVINGASDLLGEVFGEAGRHARSAVGVAELPLDAPVEVELVVEVGAVTRRCSASSTATGRPTRSATSCCCGWPDGCPTSCCGGCATGWPRGAGPRWARPCRASCCATGSGSPSRSASCWPRRSASGGRRAGCWTPCCPSTPRTSRPPTSGEPPVEVDAAALSVLAVVRGHPGCRELLQARRSAVVAAGARAARRDQRVVLVRGGDRPWVLTGTLQRLLRAHGDRTPCVEVLPAHGELTQLPPRCHRRARRNCGALRRRSPVGA